MLTYLQVHLYMVIPPILMLGAIYGPLVGRRELLKVLWLGLMATIWTTPWDNFILSHSGWSYPPGSIIGKIFYIPIEEHMFFILQPILIILLHCIVTHGRLLPFDLALPSDTSDVTDEWALEPTGLEGAVNRIPSVLKQTGLEGDGTKGHLSLRNVQTLPRRPLAASIWLLSTLLGLLLVLEAHDHIDLHTMAGPAFGFGLRAFYQGWILLWISPVIGFLTYLGGRLTKQDQVALVFGTGYLWIVDTVALRSGSWSISTETTFGLEIWRGLPVEEGIFFFLTSYLIILSISLISHLHTLLLLSPDLPPCPPSNPIHHITLLAGVALSPPLVDRRILQALIKGEQTLRKGSKSFDVAKLAFGREMRLGLVVIYAWCRVTDNLIDEPYIAHSSDGRTQSPSITTPISDDSLNPARFMTLAAIRKHLIEAYKSDSDPEEEFPESQKYPAQIYRTTPDSKLNRILDEIPHLTQSDRSAFHLFSKLVPRLVPIYPFQELCDGYETDLRFPSQYIPFDHATGATSPSSSSAETVDQGERQQKRESFDLTEHLPIRTTNDLLKYADDVAGSIASAICYLAWSVLTSSATLTQNRHRQSRASTTRPVDGYTFAPALHDKGRSNPQSKADTALGSRLSIIRSAREMGRALQLVNISRDIAKDALISRVYVPLSWFPSASSLLSILYPARRTTSAIVANATVNAAHAPAPPSYPPYTLRLLDLADNMRCASADAIEQLPRTARAGIRAMVASYFEIAVAVRRQDGEVDERGVRVSKKRRISKAMTSIWLGGTRASASSDRRYSRTAK